MTISNTYPISDTWKNQAKINKDEYDRMYEESIKENEKFWSKQFRNNNA